MGAGEARHRLCDDCYSWLSAIVGDVRHATVNSSAPILGAPFGGTRSLVFEDQCHLCREIVHLDASLVECVAGTAGVTSWQPILACMACDAWLASVADDGRSARGEASRTLDGAYGRWLHPNLGGLRVSLDVQDEVTNAVVRATCRAMGVVIEEHAEDAGGALRIIEARHPDRATQRLRLSPHAARAIVLAPLSAHADLAAALDVGASDWLTIPLTPQQLTAALVRGRTGPGVPATWDPAFCLPVVHGGTTERPVLRIAPRSGQVRFDVAWAVKRFCRGYDEIGCAGDHILMTLKAPRADAPRVAARLQALLGDRCTFEVVERLEISPRQRLELAG